MANYYNCTFHIQHFYSDGELENKIITPNNERPKELQTETALHLWKIAQDNEWVDSEYQPNAKLTQEQVALLADTFAKQLNLRRRWAYFERYWQVHNLRSSFDSAIGRQSLVPFYDDLLAKLKA